ncbi:MAG: DUF3179 domain-containing protein [Lysobacter sp.]|nr:DUF3179 domain-containing protein [Lysobacter sp.]MDQ3269595.1 DUF3179 domain-containing protein [Pseudomonadota bacterium]
MTSGSITHKALLAIVLLTMTMTMTLTAAAQKRSFGTNIVRDTFGYTDKTPSDFPWKDIEQGCPVRDCIPSIDKPKFIEAKAATFLKADDLVLAINHKGVRRAYPTRILNYHEIVNDTVAGDPIAITWCPLCGSGVAFHRVLGGKTVQFGVSGLLHNSDLILYDRSSNSLWQQITAKAFAGPRRGQTLSPVPLTMTTWSEWRKQHPDTKVLSTDTGRNSNYAVATPYGDYDSSRTLMFPVSAHDPRLHPKTVVYALELGKHSFAVTERALKAGPVNTKLGKVPVRWVRAADGTVSATRTDTRKALVPTRLFWFAWFTFHPATGLHDLPPKKRAAKLGK